MYRSARPVGLTLAAVLVSLPPLQAQSSHADSIQATQAGSPAPVATTTQPKRDWFTRRDAITATAFVLGTAAMFPFDERIASELQRFNTRSNRYLGDATSTVEAIASPGSFWIGATMYAVGKVAKKPRLADVGLHGTEAIILSTVVHDVLKGVAGRARPYMTEEKNSADFDLFRGFGSGGDYRAFPSGHTSTAFAAASAVTAEVSHSWPKATPYVGTLMYGGATMVALSRMYNDKHWASDVVLGAAIGTFSGWKVVQFHHDRPRNVLDRMLLSASVMPDAAGGVAVGWTLPVGW